MGKMSIQKKFENITACLPLTSSNSKLFQSRTHEAMLSESIEENISLPV